MKQPRYVKLTPPRAPRSGEGKPARARPGAFPRSLIPRALFFCLLASFSPALAQRAVTVDVFSASGARHVPDAVAYQIEDGPWTFIDLPNPYLANPEPPRPLSFEMPEGSSRYGVVVDCSSFGSLFSRETSYRFYALTVEEAGDLYLGVAEARRPGTNDRLSHFIARERAGPFAFALPEPWPDYSIGPALLPVLQDLSYGRDDPFFIGYALELEAAQQWTVVISLGYLGEGDAYALPEVTGLAGFNSAPELAGPVDWRLTALFANRPLGELLSAPTVVVRAPGAERRSYALPDLDLKQAVTSGSFRVR